MAAITNSPRQTNSNMSPSSNSISSALIFLQFTIINLISLFFFVFAGFQAAQSCCRRRSSLPDAVAPSPAQLIDDAAAAAFRSINLVPSRRFRTQASSHLRCCSLTVDAPPCSCRFSAGVFLMFPVSSSSATTSPVVDLQCPKPATDWPCSQSSADVENRYCPCRTSKSQAGAETSSPD